MPKNFIKIKSPQSDKSEEAFVKLMETTENILNDKNLSSDLTPLQVEKLAEKSIKEATKIISFFQEEDIILVSGHQFPDIKIDSSFGVEVKTSQKGWTSIGSSIIESTRIPGIESIYMLFGNMELNPSRFLCKPYGDVLTDIKVTHSPRYSINMKTEHSVFDDMGEGMTYNKFRCLPDSQKIEKAQIFSRKKFEKNNSNEMPWWIKDLKDNSNQGSIKLWNSLDIKEKDLLVSQCMILFPEVLYPFPFNSKYNRATLWLCSYHQIVSPNIRDNFSAGGMKNFEDSHNGLVKIPAIYGKVKDHLNILQKNLESPSKDFLIQIEIYNPSLFKIPEDKRFEKWLSYIYNLCPKLPIYEYLFGEG